MNELCIHMNIYYTISKYNGDYDFISLDVHQECRDGTIWQYEYQDPEWWSNYDDLDTWGDEFE